MEEIAIKAFTPAIQQEIFARLRISDPVDLGGFENFVFSADDVIIRISHDSHRTTTQLNAELTFVDQLAIRGAPVCRPLHAVEDQWLITVGEFHVCRFERAAGRALPAEPFSDQVIRHWGSALGQFHAVAMTGLPRLDRPHWRDDANHDFVARIPSDQSVIVERGLALLVDLAELPDHESVFGLIHSDAHTGNFFVDDSGEITVFDFDDCLYAWFGYDLATILLGVLLQPWMSDDEAIRREYVTRFTSLFLEGYTKHSSIDCLAFEHMQVLIKLREYSLYAVIHAHEMEVVDDSMAGRFLAGRRERMEQDVPFIDYDFGRLL